VAKNITLSTLTRSSTMNRNTRQCLTTAKTAMVHDDKYDTIRYDSVYLTCSKKLTGSQLSPPHGIGLFLNKSVFVDVRRITS